MIPRATYQPGQAAEEAEMFPSHRADGQELEASISASLQMDAGLAWCESVREFDPEHRIALELSRRLRGAAE